MRSFQLILYSPFFCLSHHGGTRRECSLISRLAQSIMMNFRLNAIFNRLLNTAIEKRKNMKLIFLYSTYNLLDRPLMHLLDTDSNFMNEFFSASILIFLKWMSNLWISSARTHCRNRVTLETRKGHLVFPFIKLHSCNVWMNVRKQINQVFQSLVHLFAGCPRAPRGLINFQRCSFSTIHKRAEIAVMFSTALRH
jgi:hypothetical protein